MNKKPDNNKRKKGSRFSAFKIGNTKIGRSLRARKRLLKRKGLPPLFKPKFIIKDEVISEGFELGYN